MAANDNVDTFVFYPTFLTSIEAIKSVSMRLAMFEAVANYGVYGCLPDFTEIDPNGLLDGMFLQMRFAIDDAKAKRSTLRENAKGGGAPKGNMNACKNNQKQPNSTKNNQKQPNSTKNNQKQPNSTKNNPNVNVNVNDNVNISCSEDKAKSVIRFVAPTLDDIQSFCKDEAISIDTDLFYNHFVSVGWKVGNKQMKDWKAAVKVWARRDETKNTETKQKDHARRYTETDSRSWKDYEGDF